MEELQIYLKSHNKCIFKNKTFQQEDLLSTAAMQVKWLEIRGDENHVKLTLLKLILQIPNIYTESLRSSLKIFFIIFLF